MNHRFLTIISTGALGLASMFATAQNPIVRDQFTADPTARVFNGKMYLYPSHDIPSPIESLKEWFCMADYHVFSSDNLVDWTDHGMIITQNALGTPRFLFDVGARLRLQERRVLLLLPLGTQG